MLAHIKDTKLAEVIVKLKPILKKWVIIFSIFFRYAPFSFNFYKLEKNVRRYYNRNEKSKRGATKRSLSRTALRMWAVSVAFSQYVFWLRNLPIFVSIKESTGLIAEHFSIDATLWKYNETQSIDYHQKKRKYLELSLLNRWMDGWSFDLSKVATEQYRTGEERWLAVKRNKFYSNRLSMAYEKSKCALYSMFVDQPYAYS